MSYSLIGVKLKCRKGSSTFHRRGLDLPLLQEQFPIIATCNSFVSTRVAEKVMEEEERAAVEVERDRPKILLCLSGSVAVVKVPQLVVMLREFAQVRWMIILLYAVALYKDECVAPIIIPARTKALSWS